LGLLFKMLDWKTHILFGFSECDTTFIDIWLVNASDYTCLALLGSSQRHPTTKSTVKGLVETASQIQYLHYLLVESVGLLPGAASLAKI
jgi:hypothetical protein